jgi:enamine deaminase RidA (YjgF/YER057c/UK114 family)
MRLGAYGAVLVALVSASAFGQVSGRAQVTFKNSTELSSPAGYSHAVVVNGGKVIYLSGQVGSNKQGEMVGKDNFRAQAAQVFANLRAELASAGATPKDVVKLNYYVVGLNHERVVALREVRDQFIDKEHPPASTLAGVAALFREDAMLEVEAVAVLP